ncbi:hypothetical protein BpHYR1_017614 [Brachionus plicatilis]|uniref:Uncharacterized protein n=1 Tax=Brachionus plicatilis TaxID=10195 RepID=A0A3M7S5X5_BRAPC|nr:hypothetical protein BpHYR1_017614 [Brachionus plicatilis]
MSILNSEDSTKILCLNNNFILHEFKNDTNITPKQIHIRLINPELKVITRPDLKQIRNIVNTYVNDNFKLMGKRSYIFIGYYTLNSIVLNYIEFVAKL